MSPTAPTATRTRRIGHQGSVGNPRGQGTRHARQRPGIAWIALWAGWGKVLAKHMDDRRQAPGVLAALNLLRRGTGFVRAPAPGRRPPLPARFTEIPPCAGNRGKTWGVRTRGAKSGSTPGTLIRGTRPAEQPGNTPQTPPRDIGRGKPSLAERSRVGVAHSPTPDRDLVGRAPSPSIAALIWTDHCRVSIAILLDAPPLPNRRTEGTDHSRVAVAPG